MTTIRGLERVSAKLTNLKKFSQWAHRPMTETVSLVQDEVAKYPPKAQGAFTRYATAAQKRAYWARVRSGEITHREDVGYVRSGTLGRKWTTKVANIPNGVRGEVGNVTGYARYVQYLPKQQLFHKASGWPTDVSVLRKTEGDRRRVWAAAVKRILD